ncbi:MAG: HPr family phosphocarrier protein [Alphaproteobacteria bacterium]|nr:HPr family phosphocarrier protein [Alphaproteobacteria bacterium]
MARTKRGTSRQRVKIVNERGLHARAAARFVKLAEQFDADIHVAKDEFDVPGTSIMGLLMLGAARGSEIEIRASGREAADAIAALAILVDAGFDEG